MAGLGLSATPKRNFVIDFLTIQIRCGQVRTYVPCTNVYVSVCVCIVCTQGCHSHAKLFDKVSYWQTRAQYSERTHNSKTCPAEPCSSWQERIAMSYAIEQSTILSDLPVLCVCVSDRHYYFRLCRVTVAPPPESKSYINFAMCYIMFIGNYTPNIYKLC